jgi:hypothetical protein
MNSGQNSAFEQGMRLLQAGDARAAADHLYQAVQQNPSDGRACGYLGIALIRVGEVSTGVAWLQEAARLQPTDSTAQYNLAVALTQAQRLAEAKAALQQALALDPNNAKARAALARLPADVPQAPAPAPAAPATPSSGYDLNSWPVQQAAPTPIPPSTGLAPPPPSNPGMLYTPRAAAQIADVSPPTGTRIARGLGWGALFGQWWTLWIVFWDFIIWPSARPGGSYSMLVIIVGALILGIFFCIVGGLLGLIIGAMDAMPDIGATIGIVFGLVLMALEMWLGGGFRVINVFFWIFTGRFVGRNIAYRVQRRIAA